MVKRFVLPDRPGAAKELVHTSRRHSLDYLQDCGQSIRPTCRIAHWSQQHMYMIGHDDRGMKFEAFSVVVCAMLKNQAADTRRKWLSIQLPESHKDCSISLLVMR